MSRNKFWFSVHSFTGIITGLMLFLICWTGTFAVLSTEFDWLVTPELRQPVSGQNNWPAIWQGSYGQPDSKTFFVVAPPYAGMPAAALIKRPDEGFRLRLLEPATGETVALVSAYTLQRFFRDMHRRIFYPMPWGVYIVGFFGLTLLMSLTAALVFYKHWWRRFFQFKAKNLRSLLSSAHKTLGLWSIWFIIVISVTGLWYVFESVRVEFIDGVINYAGDEKNSVIAVDNPRSGDIEIDAENAFKELQKVYPELDITLVQAQDGGILYAQGQTGWPVVRDRANQIFYDTVTYSTLYQQTAGDLPIYWLWADMADPLHFGNFAGLPVKIIWFIFGLILSGIILTGTYLHARRVQQHIGDSRQYHWRGTQAATIVTLLVWLAAVPVAVIQAKNFFGDTIDGRLQIAQPEPGVSLFIWVWTILTVLIVVWWYRLLCRPQTI